MPRIAHAALVLAAITSACGSSQPSPGRYADACTTFCENGYDCVGDPDGRSVNCRSSCEGAMPAPGMCESAAVAWASCLAQLTCPQILESGFEARYCGRERASYDAACLMPSDGGPG